MGRVTLRGREILDAPAWLYTQVTGIPPPLDKIGGKLPQATPDIACLMRVPSSSCTNHAARQCRLVPAMRIGFLEVKRPTGHASWSAYGQPPLRGELPGSSGWGLIDQRPRAQTIPPSLDGIFKSLKPPQFTSHLKIATAG